MLVNLLIVLLIYYSTCIILKELLDNGKGEDKNNNGLAIHHRHMEIFSMSPVMLQATRVSISSISIVINVMKTQVKCGTSPFVHV